MEIQEHTLKILKASEGKYLTQIAETLQEHESRLYVKQITVTEETKDSYREATLEEKEAFEVRLQESII